jgi:ATP-binding cassette, subfamily G (WHITE), member 2, SNQ2
VEYQEGSEKRLSIAEMLIARASVCCWHNSTLGLDSSSAADYIRSLRILPNVYRTTTLVSLYQASGILFDYFDKVLILEDGEQVYFGPVETARSYFESLGFESLPGQSNPDYLTAAVDLRQHKTKSWSAKTLAGAFRKSEIYARNASETSDLLRDNDSQDFQRRFVELTKREKSCW